MLLLNSTGCVEISVSIHDADQLFQMTHQIRRICIEENLKFSRVHTFFGDSWSESRKIDTCKVLSKFTGYLGLTTRQEITSDRINFLTAS